MAGANPTDNTPFFIVYEVFNFLFSMTFLFIFTYRFITLKKLSKGIKYQEFFPRLRVVMAISYIILSIAVIVYNLIIGLFPSNEIYEYVLQGGGASVINSIVLILQLLVLKLELGREQNYTRYHQLFFFSLMIFSTIRFVLSFQFGGYGQAESIRITNIVFSGVLDVLSFFQFAYWAIKRHYLPHFRTITQINITKELVNQTIELPSPGFQLEDQFPYLIPWVSVQDGQIRVILELKTGNPQGTINIQQSDIFTTRFPLLPTTANINKKALSCGIFSLNQLKSFIVRCSRLPQEMNFSFQGDLPQIALSFRKFLATLLKNKSSYQKDILKALRLKEKHLHAYERYQIRQLGPKNDPYAAYCSIQVFSHMWVQDHYEFCIKAAFGMEAYTARRFSDFTRLHEELKLHLREIESKLQLPPLPRKILSFYLGKDGLKNRQKAIETYLRELTNDYFLMQEASLRMKIFEFVGLNKTRIITPTFHEHFYQNLNIVPKEVAQVMSGSHLVTLYEFQLKKGITELRILSKRYSQFQALHQNLNRWAHNAEIPFEIPKLPSIGYFTSQTKVHNQLASYISELITLPGIGRVYSVNAFFKAGQQIFMTASDNSDLEGLKNSRVNLLTMRDAVVKSSRQSHFQDIIDDLGNEGLDLC